MSAFKTRSRHHQDRKMPALRNRTQAKYPHPEDVRKTRDVEWIRQNGTRTQKKALKAEGI